jgi:hypothetical protein
MSKLRVVTPRAENYDNDQDIRGLGQSDLFSDLTPLPFLAVKNVSNEMIKQAVEKFNLVQKPSDHKDVILLLDEHFKTSHKEKSVMLMGAGLLISHHAPNAQMLMTVENRLRNTLLVSFETHQQKPETKDELVGHWLQKTSHFTLSSDVQLFLHQAGFDIQVGDHEVHMTHQEVSNQTKHLLSSFQKTNQKVSRGA